MKETFPFEAVRQVVDSLLQVSPHIETLKVGMYVFEFQETGHDEDHILGSLFNPEFEEEVRGLERLHIMLHEWV